MRKWMNTMFFGGIFIAALLIEAYCIQILDGDLFSTVGLGIAVVITGYLFMDSIRSVFKKGSEDVKFHLDRVFNEETEKWSERYAEFINLQKASYTATKKNSAMITQQFEEVLVRLEALENNNSKAWQKITELQKKSLEGQKNALNLEISYNKENTKRLMGLLKSEIRDNDVSEKIINILSLLEKNNELLQARINLSEGIKGKPNNTLMEGYQETDMAGHSGNEEPEDENTPETDWSLGNEAESEADNLSEEADNNIKVTPLYADPNKNLSAEEIAALFASIGK